MSQEIDTNSYTQLPIFDVGGGIALATSLRAALPPRAPAAVKKAAEHMTEGAEELAAVWREVGDEGPDVKRPADIVLDRAWASLFGRLESYAALPSARVPAATKASDLLAKLFPNGLTFLKLPYAEEWAESDKRLKQIVEEGWARDLDKLAGHEFLEEVKIAHEAYGLAIGVTRPIARTEAPARAERLRDLRRRMNRYVLNVLALAGEDDETNTVVRAALKPIDDFRLASATRRGKNAASIGEPVDGAGGPADPAAPAPTPTPTPSAPPV